MMTSIYGNVFLTKNGQQDSGVWQECLKDLTPKAIEKGIERLMKLDHKFIDFPPNCLQFRALCLAYYEELHLPSASLSFSEVEQVLAGAKRLASCHQVVRYIAAKLPRDFFDKNSRQEAYKKFEALYNKIVFLLKQGNTMPEVNIAISKQPASAAIAERALGTMRRLLGATACN